MLINVEPELVIVGGGIAGATLAKKMSESGARVLVVEKETVFKDRVRGDGMTSWGAQCAQDLGIYDLLLGECGHELPTLQIYVGGVPIADRDLISTTPQSTPFLTFFHPEMQETLLAEAECCGAQVLRGARATVIRTANGRPEVTISTTDSEVILSPRLVVAADGRNSPMRKSAEFEVSRDPEHLVIAGLLLDGVQTPEEQTRLYFNPDSGQAAYLFPQRNGRVRAYAVHQSAANVRLSGTAKVPTFIEALVHAGVPAEFVKDARATGPLACFDGAAYWVDHPYDNAIALIGDAAASSDPVWGEGLSLALLDVHSLWRHLTEDPDWDSAGNKYAEEHDRKFSAVHEVCNWYAEFFLSVGDEASHMRHAAFPKFAEDPSRVPDLFGLGPQTSHDPLAKARFFGTD
jgi:2-polyprenyl-6-methoxyphenol hydroxylase-like FAD-dependent oxidoreductase